MTEELEEARNLNRTDACPADMDQKALSKGGKCASKSRIVTNRSPHKGFGDVLVSGSVEVLKGIDEMIPVNQLGRGIFWSGHILTQLRQDRRSRLLRAEGSTSA